jgi:Acyl carrier protein
MKRSGGVFMSDNEYDVFLKLLRDKLFTSLKNIEITPNSSLKEELMIDSLNFYSLLIDVEKSFGISFDITSRNAKEFKTVGSMMEYMDRLKGAVVNGEEFL